MFAERPNASRIWINISENDELEILMIIFDKIFSSLPLHTLKMNFKLETT